MLQFHYFGDLKVTFLQTSIEQTMPVCHLCVSVWRTLIFFALKPVVNKLNSCGDILISGIKKAEGPGLYFYLKTESPNQNL